ncbi:MAG: Ig-like domain-containing protein [Gemmatimonadales bacterium]
MQHTTSRFVLPVAALLLACGGDSPTNPGPPPPPPPAGVLTSVLLSPTSASLFTVAPGTSVTIAASGRNQNGQPMSGLSAATFSSDNPAVATVNGTGLVTAGAVGNAQITVSLSAAGVTRTANAAISVKVAPASATVRAPDTSFLPQNIDIAVGGTVTWAFEARPHNVIFSAVVGAPANLDAFSNNSASRTFTTNGVFPYVCELHSGMSGIVTVH